MSNLNTRRVRSLTYLDEIQTNRFRMAILGTKSTPTGVGTTKQILFPVSELIETKKKKKKNYHLIVGFTNLKLIENVIDVRR